MSDLKKIGVRFSPLSERVLLARFGKDPDVALDTRDVMNEFLHVLVQLVGEGNALDFGGGDEQFTVTLVRKIAGSGAQAAAYSSAPDHASSHEETAHGDENV